jgi:hypothetical protein
LEGGLTLVKGTALVNMSEGIGGPLGLNRHGEVSWGVKEWGDYSGNKKTFLEEMKEGS